MTEKPLPRLYDDPPSSSRGRDVRPETIEESKARVGQLLAGKYRLEEVIGSGGMAHVYRATNTAIDRTVAIKILRREQASVPEIVERFLREARTANRVQHPHVVDVTDVGQDSDGSPFLVQEYLEGETLFDYAQRQGGKLSVAELAEIMGPVLSAVGEAHDRGVVHRDLKPENVFLAGRRGRRIPKVLDFGISKVQGGGDLTAVGVMMGTPAYMAPELGISSKDADARTDVWALGVIIFEMLSAKLPFEGETVGEVLLAVATRDPIPLKDVAPEVPERISEIVAKCLRRNPDERYKNATALARDLAQVLEDAKPGTMAAWSLPPPSTAPGPAHGDAATTLESARPDFIDAPPFVPKPAAPAEARARSSERMRAAPLTKEKASEQMKAAADALASRESAKMESAKVAEPAAEKTSTREKTSSREKTSKSGLTQPGERKRKSEPKSDAVSTGKRKAAPAPKPSFFEANNLIAIGAVVVVVLAAIVVALRLAG